MIRNTVAISILPRSIVPSLEKGTHRSDTITRRPDVSFPKGNRQVFWGNPSSQMGPNAFFKAGCWIVLVGGFKVFFGRVHQNKWGEFIPNITCAVAFGKGFCFEDLVTSSPPHSVVFGASCNEASFESQVHQSKGISRFWRYGRPRREF